MKSVIFCIIFILFQSCINFYEEGTVISLKTQKERLLSKWKKTQHIIDGQPQTLNQFEEYCSCILVPYSEYYSTTKYYWEVYLENNKTRLYDCYVRGGRFTEITITYLSNQKLKGYYIDNQGRTHQLEFKKIENLKRNP